MPAISDPNILAQLANDGWTDVLNGGGGFSLHSPVFTGIPRAPTAAKGTNSTQIATTAFVVNQLAELNLDSFNFDGPIYVDGFEVYHKGNLNLDGIDMDAVLEAINNFQKGNDRNTSAIPAPTMIFAGDTAEDGVAIDHTVNDNGSVDISVEWQWPPAPSAWNAILTTEQKAALGPVTNDNWSETQVAKLEEMIDGFIIYQRVEANNIKHVFNNTANEFPITVTAKARSFVTRGVVANKFYTFAVRAFRMVDTSIVSSGYIYSPIAYPPTGEYPYRPEDEVKYYGDVLGTIAGLPVANFKTGLTNFNKRNDRIGTTPIAPTIPTDGTAIDHVNNPNGSVDITFEWDWPLPEKPADKTATQWQAEHEASIDGFMVSYYVAESGPTAPPRYPFTNPSHYYTVPVSADKRAFALQGVSPTSYYSFAVRTFRIVDPDISATGYKFSALVIADGSHDGKPENPFRPRNNVAFDDLDGTLNGKKFSTVTDAVTNFDKRNDRMSEAAFPIPMPTFSGASTIQHVINTDSSVDITFEWDWEPAASYEGTTRIPSEKDIDGFIVYQHIVPPTKDVNGAVITPPAHNFATPSSSIVSFVERDKRAILLSGVPADSFYSFAVRAYRVVDTDIDSDGYVMSTLAVRGGSDNPYHPEDEVAFKGDITGTVGKIPVGIITSSAQNFNRRNDRMGEDYPIPAPIVATGSASDDTNAGGTAVTHEGNVDGSVNLSFNWSWFPPAEYEADDERIPSEADIDGFMVYAYTKRTAYDNYIWGSDADNESIFFVPAGRRRHTLMGVPSNHYYTFSIKAYRIVDPDVDGEGYVFSPVATVSHASETPYYPGPVVFTGDVGSGGTIGGIPVGDVLAGLNPTFETEPPSLVTGLALSSRLAILPNGGQQATLTAEWNANAADEKVNTYSIAIKEGTGSFIEYLTSATITYAADGVTPLKQKYEWPVLTNTLYTVKVRAEDRNGNQNEYCLPVSHTTAKDNTVPNPPTNLKTNATFKTIYLSWKNPTQNTDNSAVNDLAFVEVFENSVDSTDPDDGFVKIGTVHARDAGAEGSYTRGGLTTGAERFFWLRAVDSSGNISALTSTTTDSHTETEQVPTTDIFGQLDEGHFPPDLRPVEVVTSLPVTGNFEGRMAFYQGKLYRYTNGAWSAAVNTEDLDQPVTADQIDSRGLDLLNAAGEPVFASNGFIGEMAFVQISNGNTIALSTLAANNLTPSIHYVGEYPNPPTQASLGASWRQNAVYKNSLDGKSYILTGEPLGWVVYLSDGNSFSLVIESSNGNVFRVGQNSSTLLKARLFKNGAEVTDITPEAWFSWRRVSGIPREAPNDDATFNTTYSSGYRAINLNVDDVYARATFFCDVKNS